MTKNVLLLMIVTMFGLVVFYTVKTMNKKMEMVPLDYCRGASEIVITKAETGLVVGCTNREVDGH